MSERKNFSHSHVSVCLAWMIPYLLFIFFITQIRFTGFLFPQSDFKRHDSRAFEAFKKNGGGGWRFDNCAFALYFLFYIYPNSCPRKHAARFGLPAIKSVGENGRFSLPQTQLFDLMDTNNRCQIL